MEEEEGAVFPPVDCLGTTIAFDELVNLEGLSEQSLEDLDVQLDELLFLETSVNLETQFATRGAERPPLADTEVTEVSEAVELPEAAEPPEAVEALEAPEAVELPEAAEPPEAVEAPEPPEAVEAPEAPEAVEAPEPPEEMEAPELPEAVEAPEPPEAVEAPELPEVVEAPEAPEVVEAPELPEVVEAPEAPEAVEASPEAKEEGVTTEGQGEKEEFVGVEYSDALQMESSDREVIEEHVLGLQQVQPIRLVVSEAPVETTPNTAPPTPPVAHHTPTPPVAHHAAPPVELASNLPELEAILVAGVVAPSGPTCDLVQEHTPEERCDDDCALDVQETELRASFEDIVQKLETFQEEKSSGESHFMESATDFSSTRRGLRKRGSSLETARTLTREFISDTKIHQHTQLTPLFVDT